MDLCTDLFSCSSKGTIFFQKVAEAGECGKSQTLRLKGRINAV